MSVTGSYLINGVSVSYRDEKYIYGSIHLYLWDLELAEFETWLVTYFSSYYY